LGRGTARGMTERARYRVHRDDPVTSHDMRLGARAHGDLSGGDHGERPIGPALVLEKSTEPGQSGSAVVRIEGGAVVAADDEVRPLAAADLLGDDALHDGGVVLVGDVESTVGESDGVGGE